MSAIAVLCNWWNHPELVDDFCDAVSGEAWDDLVVMDNASAPETARLLDERIGAAGGRVLHRATNGQLAASRESVDATQADVLVFLNNDVRKRRAGWLAALVADVEPGTLCAHEMRSQLGIQYLDGWCLAVHRSDWERLGGYDSGYEEPPYWADVDLSWRAANLGMELRALDVGLEHRTSTSIASFRRKPWFRRLFERNRRRLLDKLAAQGVAP